MLLICGRPQGHCDIRRNCDLYTDRPSGSQAQPVCVSPLMPDITQLIPRPDQTSPSLSWQSQMSRVVADDDIDNYEHSSTHDGGGDYDSIASPSCTSAGVQPLAWSPPLLSARLSQPHQPLLATVTNAGDVDHKSDVSATLTAAQATHTNSIATRNILRHSRSRFTMHSSDNEPLTDLQAHFYTRINRFDPTSQSITPTVLVAAEESKRRPSSEESSSSTKSPTCSLKRRLDQRIGRLTTQKSQSSLLKLTPLVEKFFRPQPFDRQRFTNPISVGRAIYGEITVMNDLLLKRKVIVKAVRNESIYQIQAGSKTLENPLNEFSIIRYLFSKTCPVDPLFIIKPYALMQDSHRTYLVQEYCAGGELYHKVQEDGAFGEDRARPIAVQILFALLSLHKNHISHRDLSLENVLLSEDGTIRLIDFGQAERVVDEHNEPIYLTGKAGKAYYRPPEVYYGSYLGGPMDVFSFGVLLYILVTGFPPFEHALPSDCRFRTISATPDGLHQSLIHEGISMSEELIDLLSSILFRPAAQRPSLMTIMTHSWIVKDPKCWTTVSRLYPHGELVRSTLCQVRDCLDAHQGQGCRLWRSPSMCLARPVTSVVGDKTDIHSLKAGSISQPSHTSWLWKPSKARL